MENVLFVTIVITLLSISVQDFKYRAIYWFLPPLLAILFIWIGADGNSSEWLLNRGLNISFILLNLFFLFLWLRLKGIHPKEVLKGYLGLGDVIFFFVIALALPFPVFPFFFLLSLLISLGFGVSIYKNTTVPLAGIQALFLLPIVTINYFVPNFNLNYFNLINL